MAEGNGSINGSTHGTAPSAQHDRKMASTGAGKSLTVELASINGRKTTFKGGRYIVLEGKVMPDKTERKEITLWNEVADQFVAQTSFVKPTGQRPLVVTFEGAFRKKDAYFADRDARLESWVFNAKGFEVDWRSPAGKAQYPASIHLAVSEFKQHTSKVSGLPIWVMTGTDSGKNRHKVSTTGEACTAVTEVVERLAKADLPADASLAFNLKGYWRMVPREKDSGFAKLFTAQSVENMPELKRITEPLQAASKAPSKTSHHQAGAL